MRTAENELNTQGDPACAQRRTRGRAACARRRPLPAV